MTPQTRRGDARSYDCLAPLFEELRPRSQRDASMSRP